MLRFIPPPLDHDRLFKELLTRFFWEFLQLFFPELPSQLNRRTLRFLDKEVFTDVTSGEKREADLIAQIEWKDSTRRPAWFLIHVEHQSSKQAHFGKRMFHYFARLHEKHDAPVFPIVIFSYDAPRKAEPDSYHVAIGSKNVLEFHYEVIQLNRLNWRDFLKHENPVATALMAKMNIAPEDRVKVKLECLRLLATMKLNPAKMQLISGFVDSYLKLSRAEFEQFQEEVQEIVPAEREAVMEIYNDWMLKGMEQGWYKGVKEGLLQGRDEGRHEEGAALVLRLLRRRVGELSPTQERRIKRLSIEQLEELGEALLDFSSPQDLKKWLSALKK